jgi:hypothetical protein
MNRSDKETQINFSLPGGSGSYRYRVKEMGVIFMTFLGMGRVFPGILALTYF